MRIRGLHDARAAMDAAAQEQARAQKRQRLAFSALAKAVQASSKAPARASAAAAKGWGVSVSRPGRIGGDSSSIWLACTAEELSTLERCVAEAAAAVEEAGDFAMLMVQERLAEGQARLEQLRSLAASAAAAGAGTPYPSEDTFDASGGAGTPTPTSEEFASPTKHAASPFESESTTPSPSSRSPTSHRMSHRHQGGEGTKESPMERQLRKAKLAGKKRSGSPRKSTSKSTSPSKSR